MRRFDVLKPSRTRLSARANRAGDPVEHRNAGLALEVAGEIGHAGAAKHDRLGAVLGQRPLDFLFDDAPRPRARLLERQHRNLGGAHPRAADA